MCDRLNITIEFTAPHTPQQNGMVERKFVTIRDRSVAAMLKAKFSDESQGLLWAESINTHTRLTNSVCNTNDMENSPDWIFYGKCPEIYDNLVEFGRIGWVKIPGKILKLEAKATKCIMIGYSDNHAGDTYRMYQPDTKKLINTRNIKWGEWHGKSNITTDMTVYDITENVKIPPAIVVPLPVFGDGASSTPATTIPPIKPHVHFADPEAGRVNTESASKDSK